MSTYQKLECESCVFYEAYHQYPNPNAVARHYCKKCKEEIRYVRQSYFSDFYVVWLPKACYFHNYYIESEKSKKEREERYTFNWCEIED